MKMPQLRSVVEDQYTAARIYFASIVGVLLFESLLHLPQYLTHLRHRRQPHPQPKISKPHSPLAFFIHKLRNLPPFLPKIITSHRITNLLRLLIFLGLNILFSWTRLRFSTDYKLAGWLCIANGGLTLLISPRGNNLLSLVLRIPSDSLLVYHRWCGRATVIHGTIHFALNTSLYVRTEQIASVFGELRIQVGVASFVVLCIIFISSLAFVRRKAFEVFFYLHFLFVVFVIGACIHAPHGPEFLLPGLALWAVDRLIRLFGSWRYVRVRDVKSYEGGMTKFILEGVKAQRPGTMVLVLFPGVSWNWHPFTISPNVASDIGGDDSSAIIAVRGLGGWTRSVQNLAVNGDESNDSCELATKIKLRVDGPHRVGTINWGSHPVTILVAGGIGITPGIGIAAYVIRNAAALEARAGLGGHIHLLWIVKEKSHISWFSEELTALARKAERANVTFDITIHVTGGASQPEPESQDNHTEFMSSEGGEKTILPRQGCWTAVSGRPDLLTWFVEVKAKRPGLGGAVSVCGPSSLVLGTRKAALKASSKCELFHVEEEAFEV